MILHDVEKTDSLEDLRETQWHEALHAAVLAEEHLLGVCGVCGCQVTTHSGERVMWASWAGVIASQCLVLCHKHAVIHAEMRGAITAALVRQTQTKPTRYVTCPHCEQFVAETDYAEETFDAAMVAQLGLLGLGTGFADAGPDGSLVLRGCVPCLSGLLAQTTRLILLAQSRRTRRPA